MVLANEQGFGNDVKESETCSQSPVGGAGGGVLQGLRAEVVSRARRRQKQDPSGRRPGAYPVLSWWGPDFGSMDKWVC